MSRTQADGGPQIPNRQAMAVPPNIRPPGLGGDAPGKLETGGPPVGQERALAPADVLTVNHDVASDARTSHNAGIEAPKRFFRVTKEGSYRKRGHAMTYRMYEGKVLDDMNYDIASMRQQGIKFVECDEQGEDLPAKK